MAVNTAEDIQDHLDAALVWRRIEMLALRTAISQAQSASPDSPLARALSRAGVAMLYAHWEGFFKEACQTYVDFVAKRKPKTADLNDGFLLTVMESLQRRVASGDDAAIAALLEAVRTNSARARIPRQIVNTKSNLRHEVAVEILSSLGLTAGMFLTKAPMIDKSLCDARNTIAHGRELFPTSVQFFDLHEEIMQMMELLKDEILAASRMKAYLASA
jgi:MAE_28990/MAE_18760-like HEPN